jgi:hypothetical protein
MESASKLHQPRTARRSLWSPRLGVAAVLAAASALSPTDARAFGMNAHIAVANDALSGTQGTQASLGRFASMTIQAHDLLAFAQKWPDYFRAGALGPDVFPDLIGGQVWVHPNQEWEACHKHAANCPITTTPHEQRALASWRSIDSAMYVLDQAVRYYKGRSAMSKFWGGSFGKDGSNALVQTGEQAVAFAMGYLSHVSADSFSHAYVNEFAGGYFTLFEGSGTFGQITEEVKHLAVERYINGAVVSSAGSSSIKAPQPFLLQLYTAKPAEFGPWKASPAGDFGGPHFKVIASIEEAFRVLSDHNQWKLGKLGVRGLLPKLVDINSVLVKIGTLGTGAGDPIGDIENYFSKRHQMVRALEGGWLRLSECMAQNLVEGQKGVVKQDACAQEFESEGDLKILFRGALNQAARANNGDLGSPQGNLEKLLQFASTVAERLLAFDPNTDLKELSRLNDMAKLCEKRLINSPGCEKACKKGEEVCTSVIDSAACPGCPTKDGKYSCDGLRAIACGGLPHCAACANANPSRSVCKVTVETSAPVCAFCNENSLCFHYKEAMNLHYAIQDMLKEIPKQLLDPFKKELRQAVVDNFVPKPLEETFAILTAGLRANGSENPAAGMNIVFMVDDLGRDPQYLGRLLSPVLDSGAKLDEGANFEASLQKNSAVTQTKGLAALRKAASNAQATHWNSYLKLLMGLSRQKGVWAGKFPKLLGQDFAWLDALSVSGLRKNASRLERLVAVGQRSGLFAGLEGPTLALLHSHVMKGDRFDREGFGPYANAVQLSKLSILPKGAIDGIYRSVGLAPGQFVSPSALCKSDETFTVLCDAVHSLDNPNVYGVDRPKATLLTGGSGVYAGGSTVAWQGVNDARDAAKATCLLGRTQFMLANTNDSVDKLYRRLFVLPGYCTASQLPGKPPATPTMDTKNVVHLAGTQADLPPSSTCPNGVFHTTEHSKCVCPSGKVRVVRSVGGYLDECTDPKPAVVTCPNGAFGNTGQNATCVCPSGKVRITRSVGGHLDECTEPKPAVVTCPNGTFGNTGQNATCVCPSGKVRVTRSVGGHLDECEPKR